jgi:hypothetical protein
MAARASRDLADLRGPVDQVARLLDAATLVTP